jgi:hypothetical protein
MQNGQATARASAPVASSSSVRSTLIRFPSFSLHPHAPAAGAAAQATATITWRLGNGHDGKRSLERLARRVVDVVVATEVAAVVVGHHELLAVVRAERHQLLLQQSLDVGRVVDDLVVATELRELVAHLVEAVWARA